MHRSCHPCSVELDRRDVDALLAVAAVGGRVAQRQVLPRARSAAEQAGPHVVATAGRDRGAAPCHSPMGAEPWLGAAPCHSPIGAEPWLGAAPCHSPIGAEPWLGPAPCHSSIGAEPWL